MACDDKPAPGKGPGVNFGDYVGVPIAGNWQVCVDTGAIDGATLTIKY